MEKFISVNILWKNLNQKNILEVDIFLNWRLKNMVKKNFSCELPEACESLGQLNDREKFYIQYYNSQNPVIGYNVADGGDDH